MLLNYGAGLHGHEFSGPSLSYKDNHTSRTSPSTRSSLTSSNSITHKNTLSQYHESSGLKSSRPLSGQSVRFQEPTNDSDSDMASEGDGSLVGSDCDKSRRDQTLKRLKDPRKSSVFHLAHPAPTMTQTQKLLKIHPKILLQLQLLSSQSRPKPSIDVLPSSVLIPRITRKFARLLRGKGELGSNDVIVVRSEDYDNNTDYSAEDSDTDEEGLANRDLIAVICQMPRIKGTSLGVAEIVFSDGSTCIATPLPGGRYEIRFREEEGYEITAHWWIKRYPKAEDVKSLGYADVNSDLKYAFSVIDPNFKRHPIMATITHKNLEILDSYTTLSSSCGRYPPTSSFRDCSKDSGDMEDIVVPDRTTHNIDKKMQTLIQVTGIWVSLRQNWSPCFRYNDALAIACSSKPTQHNGRVRSSSLTIETGRRRSVVCSPGTPNSTQNNTKSLTLGNSIRRVSVRAKSINGDSGRSETQKRPERTLSAGKAFVQRAAAHRAATSATSKNTSGDNYEKITLSNQVATDCCSSRTSYSSSTPSSGASFPSSPMTTTDTTVRTHRRAQSSHHPALSVYDDSKNMNYVRYSFESIRKSDYQSDIRPRSGRWKSVTNFFRRVNKIMSPHPEHFK
ncbi:hypothetical protein GcM3_146006 [Golovinomyces cichoracearum]|uniref:Uncharacterized protein n=1 Tax=Golovinomyces cichoracearum TaxID=62708 RepID=A0A420HYW3_9PEZI|nr:hypothetical protein GcM3_146006 [Golovinomyces cichoracearum]